MKWPSWKQELIKCHNKGWFLAPLVSGSQFQILFNDLVVSVV